LSRELVIASHISRQLFGCYTDICITFENSAIVFSSRALQALSGHYCKSYPSFLLISSRSTCLTHKLVTPLGYDQNRALFSEYSSKCLQHQWPRHGKTYHPSGPYHS